ncbi:MAG: hypothetical protein E7162_00425 [Firmicutes bacterium]|nr:hypothetical protein [Bacillota bacterium]
MNLLVIFLQVLLTIPLFCILEYFNKKNISTIQKILIPVIYIVILSGLCSEIKSNIYLVVIFEVILHNFYTNNIINKDILVNKKDYFINSLISIILSIGIYDYYISKVDYIFPLASEFRSLLWFLIIIFIYNLFKSNIVKNENTKKSNFIERKREYVVVMYAKLKNKYYKLVKSKDSIINRLIYSIMVYENYKTPGFCRKINVIKNRFIRKECKYGIMQVESTSEIDDEKSIKLSITKLEKDYTKLDKKLKEIDILKALLSDKYSKKEEVNDIIDVYNEIKEFENR